MIALTTFDRYVARSVLKPVFIAVLIGLFSLLAARLLRMLDVVGAQSGSLKTILEILGWLIPHYLSAAIPLALLIGLLYGFQRLSEGGEIVAFMASGGGLSRFTRPALLVALLLAFCSLLLIGWLTPQSRYASRLISEQVRDSASFFAVKEGAFLNIGTQTILVGNLDRVSNTFQRLFMFDTKNPTKFETLTAKSGRIVVDKPSDRPLLLLDDGVVLRIHDAARQTDPLSQDHYNVYEFTSLNRGVGRAQNFNFRPRGFDEIELTLMELFARIDDPPLHSTRQSVLTELNKRLVSIATIVLLPMFAIPFTIDPRSGNSGYRAVVALVLLIVLIQILEHAALYARVNNVNSALLLWGPFLVFAVFTVRRYWLACYSVKPDRMRPLFDGLGAFGETLHRRVTQRLQARLNE